MSYILEALRKSERERQLGQAPDLPAVLTAQPPSKSRWLPWLAVLLLLLLNAGVLSYFLLHGRGNDRPAAQVQAAGQPAKAAPEAGQEPVKAAVEAHAPQSIGTAPELPSRIAKVDGAAADVRIKKPSPKDIREAQSDRHVRQAKPSAELGEVKPEPARKAVRPHAPSPDERKPVMKDAADDAPAFSEKPAALPESEGRSSGAPAGKPMTRPEDDDGEQAHAADGIPLLSAMPESVQSKLPAMKINVLAYTSAPEDRFAVIDMVKYVQGDRLPSGAMLRDIRADGLVLELNGRRFRVPRR